MVPSPDGKKHLSRIDRAARLDDQRPEAVQLHLSQTQLGHPDLADSETQM
jgi:hypothetical protein